MFYPPRCPHRHCPQHSRPTARFFVRRGYYRPLCRPHAVPRFRCRTCKRGFSRQTFRADYRDHRPDLNAKVFLSLATGLGLRQTARNVRLSLRCTELKFRKIARHLRRLNLNLRRPLQEDSSLQFDELESYEGRRNTRPLTLPILIERESRFIIWAESATIRPRGRMSVARRQAIRKEDLGPRPRKDLSHRSTRRTLQRGAELCKGLRAVKLSTDEKSSYPMVARRVFGKETASSREDEQQARPRDLESVVPDQPHRSHGARLARAVASRVMAREQKKALPGSRAAALHGLPQLRPSTVQPRRGLASSASGIRSPPHEGHRAPVLAAGLGRGEHPSVLGRRALDRGTAGDSAMTQ